MYQHIIKAIIPQIQKKQGKLPSKSITYEKTEIWKRKLHQNKTSLF